MKEQKIAECWTCRTTYFVCSTAGFQDHQGPTPIYGQYDLQKHAGHDVRLIGSDIRVYAPDHD